MSEIPLALPGAGVRFETNGASETQRLAAAVAAVARVGDVFALDGDLGTGKTTFARGFIRALTRPDEEVPSPTFTLVQAYDGAEGPIYHFDLYRIDRPEDAYELGLEEAFADGMTLLEWPDRVVALLPADALRVRFAQGAGGPDSRRIVLEGEASWRPRLDDIARRYGMDLA